MADVKPDMSEPINIKIKSGTGKACMRYDGVSRLHVYIMVLTSIHLGEGDEFVFKVKKTTKMRKIMEAYASRVGKQVRLNVILHFAARTCTRIQPTRLQKDALRFLHSASQHRVKDDDTPESVSAESPDMFLF